MRLWRLQMDARVLGRNSVRSLALRRFPQNKNPHLSISSTCNTFGKFHSYSSTKSCYGRLLRTGRGHTNDFSLTFLRKFDFNSATIAECKFATDCAIHLKNDGNLMGSSNEADKSLLEHVLCTGSDRLLDAQPMVPEMYISSAWAISTFSSQLTSSKSNATTWLQTCLEAGLIIPEDFSDVPFNSLEHPHKRLVLSIMRSFLRMGEHKHAARLFHSLLMQPNSFHSNENSTWTEYFKVQPIALQLYCYLKGTPSHSVAHDLMIAYTDKLRSLCSVATKQDVERIHQIYRELTPEDCISVVEANHKMRNAFWPDPPVNVLIHVSRYIYHREIKINPDVLLKGTRQLSDCVPDLRGNLLISLSSLGKEFWTPILSLYYGWALCHSVGSIVVACSLIRMGSRLNTSNAEHDALILKVALEGHLACFQRRTDGMLRGQEKFIGQNPDGTLLPIDATVQVRVLTADYLTVEQQAQLRECVRLIGTEEIEKAFGWDERFEFVREFCNVCDS